MAFNVYEFLGTLSKQGVSKASDYEVRVNFPAKATRSFRQGISDLRFRAEAVELPGRTIVTTPYRDVGVPREIGYGAIYPPISITFLVSRDLRERVLFTNWQDAIVGDTRKLQVADGRSFNVGYYNDYIADIEIIKYNETGNPNLFVKLIEAYPRTVNQMALAYSDNEPLRLTVTFQYRYFTEKLDVSTLSDIIGTVGQIASNPRRFATEALRGVASRTITTAIPNPVLQNVSKKYAKSVIRF